MICSTSDTVANLAIFKLNLELFIYKSGYWLNCVLIYHYCYCVGKNSLTRTGRDEFEKNNKNDNIGTRIVNVYWTGLKKMLLNKVEICKSQQEKLFLQIAAFLHFLHFVWASEFMTDRAKRSSFRWSIIHTYVCIYKIGNYNLSVRIRIYYLCGVS